MRAQMDTYKPHQRDTPPSEPTREQQQAIAQYQQMKQRQAAAQQQQRQQMKQAQVAAQQQIPLAHNGQNNHGQRRNSKVPVRELPQKMPEVQHPVYPQLYCCMEPQKIDYKWDCIILDLDRTIIHGKRLSVKRWRKYVENGTIPSLAENQCSKWHRHIHRKGHQMHPFIRGRTMIYYRPFTWHLLAVLDYLKSHFGTKIIVCTKAGEHYAASVLAALISNFTSANPDLIDDVYNFHDLHDDPEEDGKPKKPFRLICNRHDLDPKKTLIVDDNATSWFGDDRLITNFWMPPCYGYQIHDIDNELQLLCKYLWDPIQQNHLKKKTEKRQSMTKRSQSVSSRTDQQQHKRTKRYQEEQKLKVEHYQQHSGVSNGTSSTSSPKRGAQEITSRSPKSVSSNTLSPKQDRYLNSPNSKSVSSQSRLSNNGNSPKNLNELQHYPSSESLQYGQSIPSTITSSYSVTSTDISAVDGVSAGHPSERGVSYNGHNNHNNNNNHISSHNKQNAVDKQRFSELLQQQQQQQQQQQGQGQGQGSDIMSADDEKMMQNKVTSIARISRGYKQRQYSNSHPHGHPNGGIMIMHDVEPSHSSQSSSKRNSSSVVNYVNTKSCSSPKSPATKTKKKGYTFFQSKSRGSKKLGNISK